MITTRFFLRLNLCTGKIFHLQLICGICIHIVDLKWNNIIKKYEKLAGVECFQHQLVFSLEYWNQADNSARAYFFPAEITRDLVIMNIQRRRKSKLIIKLAISRVRST